MPYEHPDESGSIWPNDRKTEDRQPGWKGSAKIGGVDYWVSGWVKEAKDQRKWVSLAFERKEQQPPSGQYAASVRTQAPAQPEEQKGGEFDDDILRQDLDVMF